MVHQLLEAQMSFTFKQVTWQEKRKELQQVREKVFVYEYHIPADIEFDKCDLNYQHLLGIDHQGNSIATARINSQGEIGRVAVLQAYRTNEFYNLIFQQIALCAKQLGAEELSFKCNLIEKDKFTQCGYAARGNVFMEAGIARQRLVCPLSRFDPKPFTLVH